MQSYTVYVYGPSQPYTLNVLRMLVHAHIQKTQQLPCSEQPLVVSARHQQLLHSSRRVHA